MPEFLTRNVMYVLLTAVLGAIGVLAVVDAARSGHVLAAWSIGAAVIVHIGGYWWHATAPERQPWWAYQLAQLGLVLVLVVLGRVLVDVPVSLAESALICLAGEGLGVWGNSRRGFGLAAGHLALAVAVILLFSGPGGPTGALVSLGVSSVMLVVLLVLWNREAELRGRAETLAAELSASRDEVARLTLAAERQRLARELHDTLAQGLTGITLQLEAASEYLSRGGVERAGQIIEGSLASARTTLAASREAIDDLRRLPEALAEEIRARGEAFAARTGIVCRIDVESAPDLPSVEATHLLKVLDEALANVAAHSGATGVVVRFVGRSGGYVLEVADDGVGFDPDAVGREHYGLVGMGERADLLGARLTVSSRPGATVVAFEKG